MRVILFALFFGVISAKAWAVEEVVFPTDFRTTATTFMTGKCDAGKTRVTFYQHKEYQLVEISARSRSKYFLLQLKGQLHAFLKYSWWSDKGRIPEEWITSGWIADLKYESPHFLNLILRAGASDLYNNSLANLIEIPTSSNIVKRNSDCRLLLVK